MHTNTTSTVKQKSLSLPPPQTVTKLTSHFYSEFAAKVEWANNIKGLTLPRGAVYF